ncbi:hypothetical protein CBR_g20153 [Chara braunii]|uniref:Uncharacterized protein n=1 Tax=Chara braunii TaxID=69332 RepID=A0A388KZW0_CHABU|nr:hypothetical protein CBR_g20153 [Chara braunii]|eukprot:GBG75522.1 hypothetical protein CBR_g20153 [Chara braunii]
MMTAYRPLLTERVLGEHLLAPRDDISAIRQVHHPWFSPDLLRFAQFFNTSGVYVAAEFRFAAHSQALVLAEASTYQRLSIPGVSHVSTIVVFSGDISTVDPLRHTAIRVSLRKWGEQMAAEWSQWLARHGDNLVVTDSIDADGLRTSRREPAVVIPELVPFRLELTWTRDSEHRAAREGVQLVIVQTLRTEVEGDLLGFVFGAVEPGHRQTIVWELTIPLTQLVNNLPLDIISQCDESPVPHVLPRRLTPYLQWSACLKDRTGGGSYPSRAEYLNPRGIIDVLFFLPRTAVEERAVAEEAELEDESEEETSKEAESYNKYRKKESGEDEEEEEEDQLEESEWETLGEEADRAETQEEDPEAAARRREEIAAGKQPLEYASGADLQIPNDQPGIPRRPRTTMGTLLPRLQAHRRAGDGADPDPHPPVPQFEHVSMQGIGLRPLPHPPPDYHP